MNEVFIGGFAALVGAALGVFFFGGLWWTVRKGAHSPRPVLWFFGSLLLRTSTVLIVFYLIGRDDWRWLLACLLGFIVARLIVMRVTRTQDPNSQAEEVSHAP